MDKKVAEIIAKQSNDEILEWKTCKASWEKFPIFKKDLELLEKISPTIAWKKYT